MIGMPSSDIVLYAIWFRHPPSRMTYVNSRSTVVLSGALWHVGARQEQVSARAGQQGVIEHLQLPVAA